METNYLNDTRTLPSNMTESRHRFPFKNKLARIAWSVIYVLLFRPFGLRIFRKWRIILLRLFGAKVHWTVTIDSRAKIWAPWNLEIGPYSCIGTGVDCYNQGKIKIGANTTISQKTYLCASTHDYTSLAHSLVFKPIFIGNRVWIAADAFVGPGCVINDGAVIAARAVVHKEVPEWAVVGGNPARYIKTRDLR